MFVVSIPFRWTHVLLYINLINENCWFDLSVLLLPLSNLRRSCCYNFFLAVGIQHARIKKKNRNCSSKTFTFVGHRWRIQLCWRFVLLHPFIYCYWTRACVFLLHMTRQLREDEDELGQSDLWGDRFLDSGARCRRWRRASGRGGLPPVIVSK